MAEPLTLGVLAWAATIAAGASSEFVLQSGLSRLSKRYRFTRFVAQIELQAHAGQPDPSSPRLPHKAVLAWTVDSEVRDLLSGSVSQQAAAEGLVDRLLFHWNFYKEPGDTRTGEPERQTADLIVGALVARLAEISSPSVVGMNNEILRLLKRKQDDLSLNLGDLGVAIDELLRSQTSSDFTIIARLDEVSEDLHKYVLEDLVARTKSEHEVQRQAIAIEQIRQATLRIPEALALLENWEAGRRVGGAVRVGHLRTFLEAVVATAKQRPQWWPANGPTPDKVHVPVRVANELRDHPNSSTDKGLFEMTDSPRARGGSVETELWDQASGELDVALILGVPGSGKTWLARREASNCAVRALHLIGDADDFDDLSHDHLNQLEIPLWTTADRLAKHDDLARLWPALVDSSLGALHTDFTTDDYDKLRRYLADAAMRSVGRWRVILDGFDETSHPARIAAIVPKVLFEKRNVKTRILSRPNAIVSMLDPTAGNSSRRAVVEVAELKYPEEVERVCRSWLGDETAAFHRLQSRIASSPTLQNLAQTPLFLTAMCLLAGRMENVLDLPDSRAGLIDRLTRVLIDGQHRSDPQPPKSGEHHRVLQQAALLAWTMAVNEQGWQTTIQPAGTDSLMLSTAGIASLEPLNDLLIEDGHQSRWLHRAIQEYLCAYHLSFLAVTDEAEVFGILLGSEGRRPLCWKLTEWAEVVAYMGHLLPSGPLRRLLDRLQSEDIGGYMYPLLAALLIGEMDVSRASADVIGDHRSEVLRLLEIHPYPELSLRVIDRTRHIGNPLAIMAFGHDLDTRIEATNRIVDTEVLISLARDDDIEVRWTAIRRLTEVAGGDEALSVLVHDSNWEVRLAVAPWLSDKHLLQVLASDNDPEVAKEAKERSKVVKPPEPPLEGGPNSTSQPRSRGPSSHLPAPSDSGERDWRAEKLVGRLSSSLLLERLDGYEPESHWHAVGRIIGADVSAEVLQLSSHDDWRVRWRVAERTKHYSVVAKLCSDEDPNVASVAVSRLLPDIDAETVERIADNNQWSIRAMTAKHAANPGVVDALVADSSLEVRHIVARRTEDPDVLAQLAQDTDHAVRDQVAQRTEDPDLLAQLALDTDHRVRDRIARRTEDPDLLALLALDTDHRVRHRIAQRTEDPDLLAQLALDTDHRVRDRIARRTEDPDLLALLALDTDHAVRDQVAQRTEDPNLLAQLAQDTDHRVRHRIAQRTEDPDLLAQLAQDTDHAVRDQVAQRTEDPNLLAQLAQDTDHRVRHRIAQRTEDPDLLAQLAQDTDQAVRTAANETLVEFAGSRQLIHIIETEGGELRVSAIFRLIELVGLDYSVLRTRMQTGTPNNQRLTDVNRSSANTKHPQQSQEIGSNQDRYQSTLTAAVLDLVPADTRPDPAILQRLLDLGDLEVLAWLRTSSNPSTRMKAELETIALTTDLEVLAQVVRSSTSSFAKAAHDKLRELAISDPVPVISWYEKQMPGEWEDVVFHAVPGWMSSPHHRERSELTEVVRARLWGPNEAKP